MKPSIPQGTRDFSPVEVRKRQYILNTLKNIFETSGFQPLETPSMENLSTLMGKYGEEGDRLIFKILNNGLHEKKDKDALQKEWNTILEKPYSSTLVTERALRYDLTIPFARYVVMHQNELAFPFRRYQMQPVWRADRPQRGRYREFWQCDCDVVGSNSLINEAELLCIYQSAFKKFEIPIKIKLNSRKILSAIIDYSGTSSKAIEVITAIDKLDKIGRNGVEQEFSKIGLDDSQIQCLRYLVFFHMENPEKDIDQFIDGKLQPKKDFLDRIEDVFKESDIAIGVEGVDEIRRTLNYYKELNGDWSSNIEIDFTLARGLSYYTGVIVEVVCSDPKIKMGSIGGGGRYDDLTGLFGLKGLSGVGVSFGIDRIYDVMEELGIFPEASSSGTQVLILNEKETDESKALHVLKLLRDNQIKAELYPDKTKFDKQIKYADRNTINITLIVGNDGNITIRNFATNTKIEVAINVLIANIQQQLNH